MNATLLPMKKESLSDMDPAAIGHNGVFGQRRQQHAEMQDAQEADIASAMEI